MGHIFGLAVEMQVEAPTSYISFSSNPWFQHPANGYLWIAQVVGSLSPPHPIWGQQCILGTWFWLGSVLAFAGIWKVNRRFNVLSLSLSEKHRINKVLKHFKYQQHSTKSEVDLFEHGALWSLCNCVFPMLCCRSYLWLLSLARSQLLSQQSAFSFFNDPCFSIRLWICSGYLLHCKHALIRLEEYIEAPFCGKHYWMQWTQ